MLSIKVQILEKDGRKEFVILTYEDFLRMQQQLDDYDDLRVLRRAKDMEKDAPTVNFEEAKAMLDIVTTTVQKNGIITLENLPLWAGNEVEVVYESGPASL